LSEVLGIYFLKAKNAQSLGNFLFF